MLDRLRREDDGFTLVETLAAMIVFAILAGSVAGVILNGFQLTKSNTARVTAANLAAKSIEDARSVPPESIVDGLKVVDEPTVNGVKYEVSRTANYVAESSTTSLCSGSGSAAGVQLAYKLITITVTWPSMGQVEPVRQDTLLNLGVSSYDTTKGIAAVGVTGADGGPVSGVAVTLTPTGKVVTTGADGCAVFTGLAPASYAAAVDQDGFVTPAGERTRSTSFAVTADNVTRVSLAYQRAGALAMTLTGPQGLLPPPSLGMALSSAGFSPVQKAFFECVAPNAYGCVTGTPRTAARLWPGPYEVKPGPCPQNATSTAQVTVAAGGTASAVLPLAGARIEVRGTPTVAEPAGPLVTGRTVYAVAPGNGVCAAQSWPMAPFLSSSPSLALPPGTWTFALTADGSAPASGSWPTASLVAGGPVPTLVVRAP